MRLHQLTQEQIEAWRKRRAEVGREKYGDAHLQRYGLADLMEELLDAKNILLLTMDRIEKDGTWDIRMEEQLEDVMVALSQAVRAVIEADGYLPDHLCTDEQGGERVWWSRQSRMESGEPKRCLGCGRIISDDEAYDKCFPCRLQDEQEGGGGDA